MVLGQQQGFIQPLLVHLGRYHRDAWQNVCQHVFCNGKFSALCGGFLFNGLQEFSDHEGIGRVRHVIDLVYIADGRHMRVDGTNSSSLLVQVCQEERYRVGRDRQGERLL